MTALNTTANFGNSYNAAYSSINETIRLQEQTAPASEKALIRDWFIVFSLSNILTTYINPGPLHVVRVNPTDDSERTIPYYGVLLGKDCMMRLPDICTSRCPPPNGEGKEVRHILKNQEDENGKDIRNKTEVVCAEFLISQLPGAPEKKLGASNTRGKVIGKEGKSSLSQTKKPLQQSVMATEETIEKKPVVMTLTTKETTTGFTTENFWVRFDYDHEHAAKIELESTEVPDTGASKTEGEEWLWGIDAWTDVVGKPSEGEPEPEGGSDSVEANELESRPRAKTADENRVLTTAEGTSKTESSTEDTAVEPSDSKPTLEVTNTPVLSENQIPDANSTIIIEKNITEHTTSDTTIKTIELEGMDTSTHQESDSSTSSDTLLLSSDSEEITNADEADEDKADEDKADEDKADEGNADEGNADEDNADEDNADEDNADEDNAEHANAEHANAEQANAEQANAEQANAEQANAEQANAEQANVEQANVEQANAEQANDDQLPNVEVPDPNQVSNSDKASQSDKKEMSKSDEGDAKSLKSSEYYDLATLLSSWKNKYYTVLAFFIVFLIIFLLIIAWLIMKLKKSGTSGIAGAPISPGPRCFRGDDEAQPLTPRSPPTHRSFKFDDNGNSSKLLAPESQPI